MLPLVTSYNNFFTRCFLLTHNKKSPALTQFQELQKTDPIIPYHTKLQQKEIAKSEIKIR